LRPQQKSLLELFMVFNLSFVVTILFYSLRRRFRAQSGGVDGYDGVGMLLARLDRSVNISHLGDGRLRRVMV